MGYEVTRFTHAIDEELHCSICAMVLKDPVQSPCEHLFCNDCIRGWLAVDESCPVERGPLKLEDLEPASSTVRNFINKFEIKCDFESKGCGEILKLNNLQDHVSRCEHNPNAKVICDKGCNIEVRRRDETKNCFRHLADQAVRQQKTIFKLNKDESSKLGSETSNESEVLVNERPKFRVLRGNVKISIDQTVLEVDDGWGEVQSVNPLEPTKFAVKFEILSLGHSIQIGLSPITPSDVCPYYHFLYRSNGQFCIDGKWEKSGTKWNVFDIIECGINFSSDFVNDGRDVRVYIKQNGKLMVEGLVPMPIDGLFETVFMHGGSKIKYLSE